MNLFLIFTLSESNHSFQAFKIPPSCPTIMTPHHQRFTLPSHPPHPKPLYLLNVSDPTHFLHSHSNISSLPLIHQTTSTSTPSQKLISKLYQTSKYCTVHTQTKTPNKIIHPPPSPHAPPNPTLTPLPHLFPTLLRPTRAEETLYLFSRRRKRFS
jgi:hypothetical protein